MAIAKITVGKSVSCQERATGCDRQVPEPLAEIARAAANAACSAREDAWLLVRTRALPRRRDRAILKAIRRYCVGTDGVGLRKVLIVSELASHHGLLGSPFESLSFVNTNLQSRIGQSLR